MEFFNKKQDVIDLKLTQYGRFLLSKGKFQPVFYSFFDDNIIYDSSKAGIIEEQNDSEERIREAQTMQPQISFSSLEKDFNTNYEMIFSNQAQPGSVQFQKTAEKNYALPAPLGTSDINSVYSPSWSVRYLNGQLADATGSIELLEKGPGKKTLMIPQLNTNISVDVKKFPKGDPIEEELMDAPSNSDVVVLSSEDDYSVLLKIVENNGFYQKRNFDIEIFEVVEQKEGEKIIEVLRPLYFDNTFDPEKEHELWERITPADSQDHVAHYFDLRIDTEIDPATLCEYDPTNPKLGVFADDRTLLCQEVLNQQEKNSFNIYEGGTQDIPGDIC
tara:strand:+ start:541 stop:1533 length:993 start_codon:yes stop_codon:yes gene_type:complete